MNKEYSTLQLVLSGQLTLYEPAKLVDTNMYVPDVQCLDTTQKHWQEKMETQCEKLPLVKIGNSCTCSILLNTNYST
jgi:hypothetical protein